MSLNMNIWTDKDVPLPDSVPDLVTIEDLLDFIRDDHVRLIRAKVDHASYHWQNVVVNVEFDHENKQGHFDVIFLKQ
jgi:hypothetical protein